MSRRGGDKVHLGISTLRAPARTKPACGTSKAARMTDDIMAVTCRACLGSTNYRMRSMMLVPYTHPVRAQR